MSVLGLIVEYNPFHLGHKYHLETAKKMTNSKYSVAIMSGSFVQRGEPAIIDKWSRAQMAVENGVDLVIELPYIYANKTAELFALGAIKTLNSLNIVDDLVFGSELGNIDPLSHIAQVILSQPPKYKSTLQKKLKEGLSFPKSREIALTDYFSYDLELDVNIGQVLNSSNNILAIEYLKALESTGSKINPLTLTRIGSAYNDSRTDTSILSATAIRKLLVDKDYNKLKLALPPASFEILKESSFLNTLEDYKNILFFLLRTKGPDYFKAFIDMENGLENRLVQKSLETGSISQLVNSVSGKRHSKTRIQRILIDILNEFNYLSIDEIKNIDLPYARLLAFNQNGQKLLRQIKANSEIDLITNFQNYYKTSSGLNRKILDTEIKATNIFYMTSKDLNNYNLDFYKKPYIKKK